MSTLNRNLINVGMAISFTFVGPYRGRQIAMRGDVMGVVSRLILADETATLAEHELMYRHMAEIDRRLYKDDLNNGRFIVIREEGTGVIHEIHIAWIQTGSVEIGESRHRLVIETTMTTASRMVLIQNFKAMGVIAEYIGTKDGWNQFNLDPVYLLSAPMVQELLTNNAIKNYRLYKLNN